MPDLFSTHIDLADAVWAPLEALARTSRRSPELPSFHEAEFMYMGAAVHRDSETRIHLYKHRDTRCYLNLDDEGRPYGFCGITDEELDTPGAAGSYQELDSIEEAIERADLWIFDRVPSFLRSFPADEWPPSED